MSVTVIRRTQPSHRIATGLIGLVFIMSLACGAINPIVRKIKDAILPTETGLPATEVPSATAAPAPTMSAVDILAGACRTEGRLTLIATPPEWANYREIFKLFQTTSGVRVNSLNESFGSADQLKAIKTHQDINDPESPDIVDVSYPFGEQGRADGDFQAYKVSTWDRIPHTLLGVPAKDPDGFWTGGYYAVMSMEVNTAVVKTPPTNWADLLNPMYKGQVALGGDPHKSSQAILAVFAAGLANGGSLDDAQPGLDFFKQLHKAGNFVPVIGLQDTIAKGTTPIELVWDYNVFYDKDTFAGDPPLTVVYPSPTIASMYVQAINVHAPHPHCARLWMELLHSDAGQLAWMKGYVHGVNLADMEARGVITADLAAKLPASSAYASAVLPTPAQISAAKILITNGWDKVVGVKVK